MGVINFFVVYEKYGEPVVYKVNETFMESKINKEGGFEINIDFDIREATEEELEEYGKR